MESLLTADVGPRLEGAQGRFRPRCAKRTAAQWADLDLRAAEGAASAGDLRVLRIFLHGRDLAPRVRDHMPAATERVVGLREAEARLVAFEDANGPGSALDPGASHVALAKWMEAKIPSLKGRAGGK